MKTDDIQASKEQMRVSAIVPTIGRPRSLERLLNSLAQQSYSIDEVVVADGSTDDSTARVLADPRWAKAAKVLRTVRVQPPHAVRQREAAIAISTGELLLFLDDDVELQPNCLAEMLRALQGHAEAVAVMADFNNQQWATPTRAWRVYLRFVHGLTSGAWQGRLIGPLLRYGFNPVPTETRRCDWFGAGNSLVCRGAFERAGGFSDFFLRRSTMNEDVDLSIRVASQGHILFCPSAKLGHFHDPGGRVSPGQAAEDDLFNRFHILHRSAGRSRWVAFRLVLLFAAVESTSNLFGAIRRGKAGHSVELFRGRAAAICRILASKGAHPNQALKKNSIAQ